MATVVDLTTIISMNVDDASLTGRILPMLNLGQHYIASLVDLPALDTSETVATTVDVYKVALPSDYMKGLYHVSSAASEMRIGSPLQGNNNPYYDFQRFLKKWPAPSTSNAGSITDVAVKGTELWYQEVAADTLTLHYFKKPTTLTSGSTITCLPDHLVEDLLVNFVSMRLYGILEDGVEGRKIDTEHYQGLFQDALALLKLWVPARGEPVYVTDDDD